MVITLRQMSHCFLRAAETSPANSPPLSMCVSVGHGHCQSHVVSRTLAVKSALVLGASAISNHLVAGSVMVTHRSVTQLPFFLSPKGHSPMRSMHNVCHRISSGSLGGSNPHFLWLCLRLRHALHALHTRSHGGPSPMNVKH